MTLNKLAFILSFLATLFALGMVVGAQTKKPTRLAWEVPKDRSPIGTFYLKNVQTGTKLVTLRSVTCTGHPRDNSQTHCEAPLPLGLKSGIKVVLIRNHAGFDSLASNVITLP